MGKVVRLDSTVNGVERYRDEETGKVFYKGRIERLGRTYRTKGRCKTVKEALEKREELKGIVLHDEQAPEEETIKAKRINKDQLRVVDVLEEYRNVIKNLPSGQTYKPTTLYEKERILGHMIEKDGYCIIKNMLIKNLKNEDLISFKQSLYLLLNQYGQRYKIDSLRWFTNSLKEAFADGSMKDENIRKVYADLNWNNCKLDAKERNSPTQLLLLEEQAKTKSDHIMIGNYRFPVQKNSKIHLTHKIKNDANRWTSEDYEKFINYHYHIVIDHNQIKTLDELYLSDFKFLTLFAFYYWTGLRLREALAIRLKDIYHKDDIIFLKVNKQTEKRKRKADKNTDQKYLTATKNRESRPVELPKELLTIFVQYFGLMHKLGGFEKDDLIFPRTSPTTLERRHVKMMKDAGVPLIRIHDLRHSAAYRQRFEENESPELVAQRLGHKDSGNLVKKIYAPSEYATNELAIIRARLEKENKK